MVDFDRKADSENVQRIFDKREIKVKTELTARQVQELNNMALIGFAFNVPIIQAHIKDFMELQVSKDRRSRGEYIEGLKSKISDMIDKAKANFNLF